MFTVSDVYSAIDQVISEDPNISYAKVAGGVHMNCKYRQPDGTPVCMVGQVFHRLGVLDRVTDEENHNTLVRRLELVEGTGLFSNDALDLLDRWQLRQDRWQEMTWKSIVEEAR